MEEKLVKLLILTNHQTLVSQIEEVGVDIGEPDCRLVEPFLLGENDTLSPWLANVTSQNTFMMSSDKILTLADPKPTLLEKYQNIIK
jgi:hypothetical protein